MMHEEWVVLVKQKYNPGRWLYAKMWYPGQRSLRDVYCNSEDEAKAVLDNAFMIWNTDKKHDEETHITDYKIRKRLVTDWETVEG